MTDGCGVIGLPAYGIAAQRRVWNRCRAIPAIPAQLASASFVRREIHVWATASLIPTLPPRQGDAALCRPPKLCAGTS